MKLNSLVDKGNISIIQSAKEVNLWHGEKLWILNGSDAIRELFASVTGSPTTTNLRVQMDSRFLRLSIVSDARQNPRLQIPSISRSLNFSFNLPRTTEPLTGDLNVEGIHHWFVCMTIALSYYKMNVIQGGRFPGTLSCARNICSTYVLKSEHQ